MLHDKSKAKVHQDKETCAQEQSNHLPEGAKVRISFTVDMRNQAADEETLFDRYKASSVTARLQRWIVLEAIVRSIQ